MPAGTKPFTGYAISYPKSDYAEPISFTVHQELLDKYNQDFDEDDE